MEEDRIADPRIEYLKDMLGVYRGRLAEAVAAVAGESRNTKPPDGGWSVAEVLEHLVVTERAVLDLITGFARRADPRPPDEAFSPEAFQREVEMTFFLDRTRTVTGPQPPGTLDAEGAWRSLATGREQLLAGLDAVRGLRLEAFTHVHPAVGKPLHGYQWVAFLALHEGRHAAQIRAIAAAL